MHACTCMYIAICAVLAKSIIPQVYICTHIHVCRSRYMYMQFSHVHGMLVSFLYYAFMYTCMITCYCYIYTHTHMYIPYIHAYVQIACMHCYWCIYMLWGYQCTSTCIHACMLLLCNMVLSSWVPYSVKLLAEGTCTVMLHLLIYWCCDRLWTCSGVQVPHELWLIFNGHTL